MAELSYKTEDVLARIETKIDNRLDKLESKIDALQSDVSQIKTDVAVLNTEVTNIKTNISDIKGTQTKQIWSLITIVGGAGLTIVGGVIVALWRTFFTNNL